jgi:hypothetical protein
MIDTLAGNRGRPLMPLLTVLIAACSGNVTAPSFPITVQLVLVNQTTDSVFVRMEEEESAYPGISGLAPSDSQCTELYAAADSVPVEVRSWTNPNTVYGTGWLYPLRHTSWQATVSSSGVTATTSTACSL